MGTVALVFATVMAVAWRLPHGHYRIDQWHGLLLAGLSVLALTRTKQIVWRWRFIGLWVVLVGLFHQDPYGVAWLWLATGCVLACAGERLSAISMAQVLKVMAWVGLAQLAMMLLQLVGWGYESIGSGLAGTMARRGALSAFFGLCALCTSGWRSWGWMAAAMSTGSLTGVLVPGLKRLSTHLRWYWMLAVVVVLCLMNWHLLTVRLLDRWWVWGGAINAFETPVGFRPLPSGFVGVGVIDQLLRRPDYHNTLLEMVARFGWWALPLIAGLGWWLKANGGWWLLAWGVSVFGLQSTADMPVLIWVLVLALLIRREPHGLGSV